MAGLFSSPKSPSLPPVPPPPPTPQQSGAAGDWATRQAQSRAGLQQTLLTGYQGDLQPSSTGRKKLLGGG
jgi:hypothetical protein